MPVGVEAGSIVFAIKSQIAGLRAGITAAKTQLAGLGGFVQRNQAQFRGLGIASTLAGGMITAAMGFAVKAAGDVEKAYADIKAVSDELKGGTEAAAEAMKRVEAVAEDLGKKTKFSTKEVAEGMKFVAMAGYDVNEMLIAMPGLVNLAAAADQDLAFAADALTNILSGFGETARETGRFVDVMAYTAANANVNLSEMAEALKYVGPAAKDMGFSIELTSAMIGKLGDAGIKGSMAGRNLRMAFIKWMQLESGGFTKKQAGVMADFAEKMMGAGKTANDLQLAIQEGDITFQEFITRMREAGATTGDFSSIFGAAAATQISILADQSAAVTEFTEKLKGATGAAEEMAKIKLDTFKGQMDVLKGSVETFAASIGKILLPTLVKMMKRATEITNKLMEWTKEHPKLTGAMVKFAAVIGPLMLVGGPMMIMAPTIMTTIGAFKGMIAFLPKVAAGVVAMSKTIGLALLTPPIGIIVAIISAVALLYLAWTRDWGGIQEKTRAVVNTITKYFIKFVNFMTQNVINPIISGYELFYNTILGGMGWLVEKVIGLFGRLPNFILKAFGTSKKEVEAFASDVRKKFKLEFKKIPKIAEDAFKWTAPAKKAVKGIGDEAEKSGGKFKEFGEAYKKMMDGMKKEGEELTEADKREIEEREAVSKRAQDEIAEIRKTSFEDWKKKNDARVVELEEALRKIKELQRSAEDEIAKIRQEGFDDWKEKNDAKVAEFESALEKIKQLERNAKEEIKKIRAKGFEDWKKENDAKRAEFWARLEEKKQVKKSAEDEIKKIRIESFEDWKEKNEARIKKWEEELTKKKAASKAAAAEIKKIRAESFEDWKEKNDARIKAWEEELAKKKKVQKDAEDEIKRIRAESFEDWKKNNEARIKEFYAALEKMKAAEKSFREVMAKLMGDETALLEIEIEKRIKEYRREGWTEVQIQTWVAAFRKKKEEEITQKVLEEIQKRIDAAGGASEKTKKTAISTGRVIRITLMGIVTAEKYAMGELDEAARRRFIRWMEYAEGSKKYWISVYPSYEKNLEYLKEKFPNAYKQLIKEIKVYREEGIRTYNIFLKKIKAIQEAWESASVSIKDSFKELVADIIDGVKTMEDVWTDFTIAIKRAIVDALATVLIEKLVLDVKLAANVLEWEGDFESLAEYIKAYLSEALAAVAEKAKLLIPIARAIGDAFEGAWEGSGFGVGAQSFRRGGVFQEGARMFQEGAVFTKPRAFLGVAGEGGETEILSPESTMRRIVREEAGGRGIADFIVQFMPGTKITDIEKPVVRQFFEEEIRPLVLEFEERRTD